METPVNSKREEYRYPEFDNANINCYIENRLSSQIKWYGAKSVEMQKKYKLFSILTIVLNGLIPVIILLADFGMFVKLLIAIISSTTSVLTSIQILNNYKDLWVQYRTNCELLKSLLHRFYTVSGEFAGGNPDDRFSLLVELSEKHLTSEFSQWNAAYATDKKPPPGS